MMNFNNQWQIPQPPNLFINDTQTYSSQYQFPIYYPPFNQLSVHLNSINPSNLNIDMPVISNTAPTKPKYSFKPQKKDPVLDSKDEIQKWLIQRKQNYPRSDNRQNTVEQQEEKKEMSILEQRIRKKIRILSGSAKRTQIKVAQMKELGKEISQGIVKQQKDKNRANQEDDTIENHDIDNNPNQIEVQKIQDEIKQLHQEISKTNTLSEKKKLKLKIKALKQNMKLSQNVNQQSAEEHYKVMVQSVKQQQQKMYLFISKCFQYEGKKY